MARGEDLKTPAALIAFAHNLFTPQVGDNGTKKFNATLLFDKSVDLSAMQNAAVAVAVEEWGEKAKDMIKNGLIKNPFLDGDGPQGASKKTGERHPGFAGKRFVRVTSGEDFKPKIYDRQRNPVYEKEDCPSGSQVFAVVNPFTWENQQNGKGVTFGVSLVQVIKKAEGSEILGGSGGPDPDKWLEAMDDPGEAPAASRGSDGAAGLFG